jgi:colanic acid biosynthesis glycosyl transferase WcaI
MQPAEHMPEWWRAFDAGLVLLRQNNALARVMPSTMFEAMATGTPIIFVGPRGAGSQIVEQAGAGPVVDDGDPQSVASAMLQLAEDATLRERHGVAALAAAPQYSRERHAQETLGLLQRTVGG